MRYTVVWEDAALDQLADFFLTAPVPNAVTAAQHRIDRTLRTDPFKDAEAGSEGLFRLNAPPLRAIFEVVEDDRLVRVLGLHLLPDVNRS